MEIMLLQRPRTSASEEEALHWPQQLPGVSLLISETSFLSPFFSKRSELEVRTAAVLGEALCALWSRGAL